MTVQGKVALITGGKRIDAGTTPTTYKIDPRQRWCQLLCGSSQ